MKKVRVALFSIIALAVGLVSIPAASVSAAGIRDLTGDGECGLADAILISRYLVGVREYNGALTDLDITGDYIVDVIDADAYLRYLSGLALM